MAHEHTPQVCEFKITFSTPPRKRAANIQRQRWEGFRDLLYEMYVLEKQSLKKIIKVMEDEHGFVAKEQQYRQKFSLWKFSRQVPDGEEINLVSDSQDITSVTKSCQSKALRPYPTISIDTTQAIGNQRLQKRHMLDSVQEVDTRTGSAAIDLLGSSYHGTSAARDSVVDGSEAKYHDTRKLDSENSESSCPHPPMEVNVPSLASDRTSESSFQTSSVIAPTSVAHETFSGQSPAQTGSGFDLTLRSRYEEVTEVRDGVLATLSVENLLSITSDNAQSLFFPLRELDRMELLGQYFQDLGSYADAARISRTVLACRKRLLSVSHFLIDSAVLNLARSMFYLVLTKTDGLSRSILSYEGSELVEKATCYRFGACNGCPDLTLQDMMREIFRDTFALKDQISLEGCSAYRLTEESAHALKDRCGPVHQSTLYASEHLAHRRREELLVLEVETALDVETELQEPTSQQQGTTLSRMMLWCNEAIHEGGMKMLLEARSATTLAADPFHDLGEIKKKPMTVALYCLLMRYLLRTSRGHDQDPMQCNPSNFSWMESGLAFSASDFLRIAAELIMSYTNSRLQVVEWLGVDDDPVTMCQVAMENASSLIRLGEAELVALYFRTYMSDTTTFLTDNARNAKRRHAQNKALEHVTRDLAQHYLDFGCKGVPRSIPSHASVPVEPQDPAYTYCSRMLSRAGTLLSSFSSSNSSYGRFKALSQSVSSLWRGGSLELPSSVMAQALGSTSSHGSWERTYTAVSSASASSRRINRSSTRDLHREDEDGDIDMTVLVAERDA